MSDPAGPARHQVHGVRGVTEQALALPFFNVAVAIVVLYAVFTAITGDTFNTVNLDDVLVTGMGGQPDELEMVARGKIGVAVSRDPRNMGENTANALIMHLEGREQDIPKVLYTALRTLDSTDSIRKWVPKAMLDIDAKLAE